jgi:succinate dehydrogenase / fumarate reductase cytochrome b subunit
MAGSHLCRFLQSTIGLKVLMALTGFILFGFTVAHVSGNLLVFAGAEKMNGYAQMLKANAGVLWGARLVLLASVAVHIVSAVKLTARKAAARPVPYGVKEPHGSTFASRTMIMSGPILGLFVAYHLMHLTVGNLHPHFDPHDAYHNVIEGFSHAPVALVYIVAMLALGLHLSHGVWSLLQTLGVNRPNWEKTLRRLAVLFGVLVCGGFISIPVAVLCGYGR